MKNILFFLSLIFVISCSKFDEGPDFSLRTKKARITNKWILKKEYLFFTNQEYPFNADPNLFQYLEIKKDDSYFNNSGMEPGGSGKWNIDTKKRKDIFLGEISDPEEKIIVLYFNDIIGFIVHRLSSKEMILERPGYGKYYFEAQ